MATMLNICLMLTFMFYQSTQTLILRQLGQEVGIVMFRRSRNGLISWGIYNSQASFLYAAYIAEPNFSSTPFCFHIVIGLQALLIFTECHSVY